MRTKLIEAAVLIPIAIFLCACEGHCDPWDPVGSVLNNLMGREDEPPDLPADFPVAWVTCVKDSSGEYLPATSYAAPNAPPSPQSVRPTNPFGYDCGPSMNGVAPLPTPKSLAVIGPDPLGQMIFS